MPSRHTKIVCTIGPASRSPERLAQLIEAGMDMARINASHGTQDEHAETIANVRAASATLNRPIAIMLDLQGPKIRTGALRDHQPAHLADGATVTITTEAVEGDATTLSTTYADLPNDVKAGDTILLSDGLIELRVVAVTPPAITCQIVHGGELAEHQGINLPGVAVSAPALTEKDREDLRFGVAQGVDYIALSFVRRARIWRKRGTRWPRPCATRAASHRCRSSPSWKNPRRSSISKRSCCASDGVMVARGDLGVEMPLEQVPMIQKRIIALANRLRLPVITATQMLESMIANPRPTRAEVSDVANAILDGTDAVMLSGETAVGRFPVETVRMMARIAVETDGNVTPTHDGLEVATAAQAIGRAARLLADEAHARYIIVFTRSGSSAHLISKERPGVPIVALTPGDAVARGLGLWWGVTTVIAPEKETTEALITWVDLQLQVQGLVRPGDLIVISGGMPVARQAKTNFVKLHRIGDA